MADEGRAPFPSTIFIILHLLLSHLFASATSAGGSFVFNGFQGSNNLTLTGSAIVTGPGALRLTNTSKLLSSGYTGHAFYAMPLRFEGPSSVNRTSSFSSQFVFAIVSEQQTSGCCGFAFTVAPSSSLPTAVAGNFMGLVNKSTDGKPSNHIFAVEFDTAEGSSAEDPDANHVGVDINSVISNKTESAAYYTDGSTKQPINLQSGDSLQAWIDYNGASGLINITLAPLSHPRPNRPLISYSVNLSPVLQEFMYVGFASSTKLQYSEHYILAWSFAISGEAPPLDLSKLPPYPKTKPNKKASRLIPYASTLALFLVTVIAIASYLLYRRWRLYSETLEEWELDYPHRFPYKELYRATKGFREKELLGRGGFGSVYKGVLPSSGLEVAVKRVTNGATQGMREFIAEISSLGRMRHRNLVQLQGWCRRREDLLLVYDFMVNGSLDSFLFDQQKRILNWEERFKILKGIASGLLYLHEGWEQVVVHRDIKASNVLLDAEMNGKLSDFGLARFHDHGSNPQTTRVVGTLGYMAPELSKTGKATTSADVFSFGAVLLEVACGRRPMDYKRSAEEVMVVDWVLKCWKSGSILHAVDEQLGVDYVKEEAELVLKLGILCSQTAPEARPTMMQVIQLLKGDASIADFAVENLVIESDYVVFEHFSLAYPSSDMPSSS